MKFLEYAIFAFIIALSSSISFAEEDDLEDDFLEDYLEETKDIACEDLPEAFNVYQQDIQANDLSIQKALRSTTQFLKKVSEEDLLDKQELLKMIEDLAALDALTMDNNMILSDRGYNISYVLTDCLKSDSADN